MKYLIRDINYYKDSFINSFPVNEYKKKKIDKMINNNEKKRSIIGEIVLDELLEENNIDYKNVTFTQNKNGKPYIENYKIFYNISHSYEKIIVAISDKEIGVDIEKIRETNVKTKNLFANNEEKLYIGNSIERLFEIYTLKEAYIKCMGLSLNKIKNIIIENVYITKFKYDNYYISICEKK